MQNLPPEIDKYVIPEPMSGCWLWLGAPAKDGYGMGWDRATKRSILAHRLVHQVLVGPIPKGACVLHRCDNPCCVNPDHLFVGSKGENNRDRHRKGRTALGERHGMNKISASRAAQIRGAAGSQRAIAAEFGVSQGLVSHIKTGRLWKSLEGKEKSR